MAVQGQSSDIRVCERCFATVVTGSEFCGECGAPVSDEPYSEGSDGAIYSELARANLLRMRGDYKTAEDVSLAILRRYPNNATANSLLGDNCAERGDLEQAAEWYELALDISPDSPAIRQKLGSVQERIKQREAAMTAEQLGLPTSRPKVALYVVLVVLILVGTGVAAYFFGRQGLGSGRLGSSGIVEAPVTLEPKQAPPETTRPRQDTNPAGETAASAAQLGSANARTDVEIQLFEGLKQRVPTGAQVLDVFQDPRSKAVTITLSVDPQDDPRNLAARVGASTFEIALDCNLVIARAFSQGKLILAADIQRQAVAQASTPEWLNQHKDQPGAFENAVLSNIWTPAGEDRTTPGTVNGSAPGSTTAGG